MRPWQLIDTTPLPDNGELRLYQRGEEEFSIMIVGGGELMNSRLHGSEDALAELGCAHLADKADARVLVGGLGMGYTLAAALRAVGPEAEVVVAELVPAVERWNREHLGRFAGYPLDDARTRVALGDVGELLLHARGEYDAILLDVDNGPEGLTQRDNDRIYTTAGLEAAYRALRPGGVLAVWSAGPDAPFSERLRYVGFLVDEQRVRAHAGQKGAWHTVWVARRGG